jgi:hypothetical protein
MRPSSDTEDRTHFQVEGGLAAIVRAYYGVISGNAGEPKARSLSLDRDIAET